MRAQYHSQAQTLRARLENRVNRLPSRLRSANMGELLQRYAQRKAGHDVPVVERVPAFVGTVPGLRQPVLAKTRVQQHGQNMYVL